MKGRSQFAGIRVWHWLLPVAVSIVVVIATSMPFVTGRTVQHPGQEISLHLSMSDHGMPDHKSSGDHKVHSVCGPGAGCFAFTLEEISTTIASPTGQIVNAALTEVLSKRSIAPPLPPPISFIIA